MQLWVGKITKQSQPTDWPSSLDAIALVMATNLAAVHIVSLTKLSTE
jgi:hypothetical protein